MLIIVYLIQTVNVSPTDAQAARFNLSTSQYVLLLMTVALPNVGIWLIGLVGYIRLNTYANLIKNSKDGAAMRRLSWGILWLLLWLSFTTVGDDILGYFVTAYPGFEFTAQLIDLYVGIAILLSAYYFLFDGSRIIIGLARANRAKTKKKRLLATNFGREALLAAYAVGSAVYIYALFSQNGLTGGHPAPYLPDWVYLITAVLPRLIAWYLGLMTVWNLYAYGGQIIGKIYQKSFQAMAAGLVMITIGFITVVLISTTGTTAYSLAAFLAIIYSLLLIVAAGYSLVAVGAARLNRIEKA